MTKKLSDEEKQRRKEARKEPKAESPTATVEKKKESKPTAAARPLKVEINFPSISDLKQALAFDADGNLIIGIQFKARVDQYEIFRLVNLLKQPHGALYAIIGSPQAAMDFKFDPKAQKVEIVQAIKALPQGNTKTAESQEPVAEATDQEPVVVKIHAVAFNHIPEEKLPYGVAIDYVTEGSGEIHTVAGRGKNPTEAVLAGIMATKALPNEVNEPFEVMAALEQLDPSPECYKLIRVIEVGSFDDSSDQGKGGKKQTKKGK